MKHLPYICNFTHNSQITLNNQHLEYLKNYKLVDLKLRDSLVKDLMIDMRSEKLKKFEKEVDDLKLKIEEISAKYQQYFNEVNEIVKNVDHKLEELDEVTLEELLDDELSDDYFDNGVSEYLSGNDILIALLKEYPYLINKDIRINVQSINSYYEVKKGDVNGFIKVENELSDLLDNYSSKVKFLENKRIDYLVKNTLSIKETNEIIAHEGNLALLTQEFFIYFSIRNFAAASSFFGTLLGLILMSVGLYNWYYKTQKYLDEKILIEVSNNATVGKI